LISKTIREGERILALKPTRVKHDFDRDVKSNLKSGTITFTSKRYKTRMMRTAANQVCGRPSYRCNLVTPCQFVRIDAVQPDGTVTVTRGRTQLVEGKTVRLSIAGGIGNTNIQSLQTIGRESPTSAEILRTHCMLGALQQTIMLSTHPFINVMWFPIRNDKAKTLWKDTTRLPGTPSFSFPGDRKLNASQLEAVTISLSSENSDRVVLIHGPPGTGKTTVIAATVTSVMSSSDNDRTLWLVAQSNVAVKNIAEKLASVDFVDFKVLVSKDFHFDWQVPS
jgi:AAA domain